MVKNKLHKYILGVSTTCTTAAALISTAHAETLEDAIRAGTADAMHQIYNIMTSVIMPICALALAWFAFRMFFVPPSKQGKMVESTQEVALRLVFAIAAVYFAPVIVDIVQSWIAYGSVTYKLREFSVFQYTVEDTTVTMSSWQNAITSIYRLLSAIGMPIAAVGIAYNAFRFVLGNEKDAESAKKSMIYIIVGIALMLLLPAIVALGAALGHQYGWDPSHPTASINDTI